MARVETEWTELHLGKSARRRLERGIPRGRVKRVQPGHNGTFAFRTSAYIAASMRSALRAVSW